MSGTAIDQELSTVPTTERDLSERVIEALAAATGTDPLAMEPLYRYIDTDALDALFRADVTGVIRFDYEGYEVAAHSDGTVTVDGIDYGGD